MSSQTLIELVYWLCAGAVYVLCGWVIRDAYKQHRWHRFEQQLRREYEQLQLSGWPFFDGLGS